MTLLWKLYFEINLDFLSPLWLSKAKCLLKLEQSDDYKRQVSYAAGSWTTIPRMWRYKQEGECVSVHPGSQSCRCWAKLKGAEVLVMIVTVRAATKGAHKGEWNWAQLLHVWAHTDIMCAAVGVLLRAVIKCRALIYILVWIKSRRTER